MTITALKPPPELTAHPAVIWRQWTELGPCVQARFTDLWGLAGDEPGAAVEIRSTRGGVCRPEIGSKWAAVGPGAEMRLAGLWGAAGEEPGIEVEVRHPPGWKPASAGAGAVEDDQREEDPE